jgi:hypothetical protein
MSFLWSEWSYVISLERVKLYNFLEWMKLCNFFGVDEVISFSKRMKLCHSFEVNEVTLFLWSGWSYVIFRADEVMSFLWSEWSYVISLKWMNLCNFFGAHKVMSLLERIKLYQFLERMKLCHHPLQSNDIILFAPVKWHNFIHSKEIT